MKGLSVMYKTFIMVMVIMFAAVISIVVTYMLRASNYKSYIEESILSEDFTPIVGASEFYYEVDDFKNDDGIGFSLYAQYVDNEELSGVFYTFIVYSFDQKYNNESDAVMEFTCGSETITAEFVKYSKQSYSSYYYLHDDLEDQCGVDNPTIADFTYKLGDEIIFSSENEYKLDYTVRFLEDNGTPGLTEADVRDMFKGRNVNIFNTVYIALLIPGLILLTVKLYKQ